MPPELTSAPLPNPGRGCISTTCPSRPPPRAAVIVGSAPCHPGPGSSKATFLAARAPRGGREGAEASCPAQPQGRTPRARHPSARGAAGPGARGGRAPHLAQRRPRRSASPRRGARCRPFLGPGGYLPPGPTSLPVKESEVGRDLLSALHLPLPRSPRGAPRPPARPHSPLADPPRLRGCPEPPSGPRASSGPARSPLPFPGRARPQGVAFVLITGRHLRAAPGSERRDLGLDDSPQTASSQSRSLKVFPRAAVGASTCGQKC